MKLTKQELQKLQDLAALQLPQEDVDDFLSKFNDVVGYLQKLQEIPTEKKEWLTGITNNFMIPRSGVKSCDHTQELLSNVEHQLTWNAITIQSFKKNTQDE